MVSTTMSECLLASKLRFFDTTLRDGEQTPGVSLNPNEKLEIATRLADLGVDVVEAGSAAASTGEQDAIRLISGAGLPVETCTFVRAVNADIDYAADNGADSVHLVIPVSDLHIEKKLRKTREQVKEMAWRSVEYAKSRGLIVELSGEDASRADQAFLAEVYAGGVERGADRLCFCDTVGVLTPEKCASFIPPLAKIAPALHPLPRRPRLCARKHGRGLKSRCLPAPTSRSTALASGRETPRSKNS